MIESEFCKYCGRPYALKKVRVCDSCLKDREHNHKVIHKLIKKYYLKDLVEVLTT